MPKIKRSKKQHSKKQRKSAKRQRNPSRTEILDPETGEITCCLNQSCELCVADNDDSGPPGWMTNDTAHSKDLDTARVEVDVTDCDNHFDNYVESIDAASKIDKLSELDWNSVIADVEVQQDMRKRLKLDSTDGRSSHGNVNVRQYANALAKPAFHHTSYHISPKSELNLLTPGDALKR